MASLEQIRHDRINLARLVRRLEKSAESDEWTLSKDGSEFTIWLKAQDALQRIKYCRKLLKNVEMYEDDASSSIMQSFQDTRDKLDRVELGLQEVEKRFAPAPSRPKSLLARIPTPTVKEEVIIEEPTSEPTTLSPAPPPAADLLLSPSEPSTSFISPIPTLLIPTTAPAQTSNTTAVGASSGVAPKFLHNTTALQQELSEQLAQMATQLRRNAVHFSESLEKDKAVVEDAQQKIEGNLDGMTKERIRLRDHRGKSQSTTCLVVASLAIVCVLFILMFFLIRFT
ncbi:hypothetical protein ONZ45_g4603 [Pleurotus djamor]|nr:hypothetical protein ONZ45_g4603 [Pleurotus djamor]